MSANSWDMTTDGQWHSRHRPSWPLALTIALGASAGAIAAFGEWTYALVILAIVMVVRWPVAATLGTLLLLVPFDNVSAIGGEATGATMTRYVAALASFVLIVLGLVSKRLSVPPRSAWWWALFVFWGTVTLGWAVDSQLAWERLPTAFSLLVLFLVCSSFLIRKEEMSALLVMTVLGGCVAAAMSTEQFFGGALFHGTTRSSLMIAGRETDPNQFAASLLLPLSLAIGGLVWGRGRLVRIGAVVATGILGLALLLTMSRGGLVAMFALVAVYVYRMRLNRRVLVAIACLALLLLVLPHSFYERLTLSDRGAGRFDIWTASLGLIPHYGLFGAGWNNFVVIYNQVAGGAPKFHGFSQGAHNIYLGTLLEVGVIGLGILLVAFRAQLRDARSLALLPYAAACWGMLTMGITLDVVWRKSFWLCWILLAMATRIQQRAMETPA